MVKDDVIPEADRIPGYPHPREARAVHGQDGAVGRFLDAWRGGRLHHAWLLRGPKGIGKATVAYRIARALIAQPGADGGLFGAEEHAIPETLDVPEGCPVQARIEAQAETRLFVLRRQYDADRKRLQTQIVIENVRALRQFLGLSAPDGGWRAIIVDPADEMNRNSANALLKLLEEPPARTVFLLVCHAPAGLLPTIRSRCRTLDLAPLGPDALARALDQTGVHIDSADAARLAELSAGSVGQSLALMAGDGLALYARLVALFGRGERIDRAAMTELAELCSGRKAADRYRLVLTLILTLVARLARAAATGSAPPEAAPGETDLIAAIARLPAQAAAWAETQSRLGAAIRHAVAVNLDPGQCVIDTLLELDATLDRVRSVAA